MAQIPAGRAVIEALRAEGVDYTFGLVGTTTNTIVTEMVGRSDIHFVDTRHEEGAAFMAYGYSRASGKPAACITTSGPGTINLITGTSLAWKGRAPIIIIAGDVARDYIYRDGSQAFDLVNMFKPVTKLALQVNKAERIPEMFHYAFRTALAGKRGPVLVDIPRDFLDHQTIEWLGQAPASYRAVDSRIEGDAQAVQQAVRLLAEAQRPLLLAGGGIIDSEASDEAVALAEHLDMAMVPSYGHNDVVPNSHRLYVGPPGGRGSAEAAEAMHRADVILALGSRLNQGSTSWNDSVIQPQTRIVQVDIDAQEIGRNYPVAAGIVGDAKAVAQQLLRTLREAHPAGLQHPEWRQEIGTLAARRQSRLQAELEQTAEPNICRNKSIRNCAECCRRLAWSPSTPGWRRGSPTTACTLIGPELFLTTLVRAVSAWACALDSAPNWANPSARLSVCRAMAVLCTPRKRLTPRCAGAFRSSISC
jgi:acetolactate synthase-1/2/3 large subunit/sulfoacetaldehyde acetyltransferase